MIYIYILYIIYTICIMYIIYVYYICILYITYILYFIYRLYVIYIQYIVYEYYIYIMKVQDRCEIVRLNQVRSNQGTKGTVVRCGVRSEGTVWGTVWGYMVRFWRWSGNYGVTVEWCCVASSWCNIIIVVKVNSDKCACYGLIWDHMVYDARHTWYGCIVDGWVVGYLILR